MIKEIQVDHSGFPSPPEKSVEWLRKLKYEKAGQDQVRLGIYSDNRGREVLLLGIARSAINSDDLFAIYIPIPMKDQEQYMEGEGILIRPLYGPGGFLEEGAVPRYCWVADAEFQVIEKLLQNKMKGGS